MLKLFICVLIIALCYAIGRLRSSRVKRRVTFLAEMAEVLKYLEADMKNERMAIGDALLKESRRAKYFGGFLTACAEDALRTPGRVFRDVWDEELAKAVRDDTALECLVKEDIELLKKTGAGLVCASLATQEAQFAMLHREYSALIGSAGNAAGKKSRLYQTMGLTAGFFIAILLL